jgi:glyoxylase-like metal-dependent hydrolase (beta-lactamase superfamily II)
VKIGPYELIGLETGRFGLDGGAMFGTVPKVLWSRTHPADDRNRIDMAMRCLLVRGDGRTILIDTGIGHKFTNREVDIYKIDHRDHSLERSLETHGVAADEVTDVVITHLHFDHAGGATIRRDGRLCPTFPNARYHLQDENLAAASRPNLRERRSYLKENFIPLQEAECLNLYRGEAEILPGIHLFPVSGHTDGQHIVRIQGGDGGTVVFCGDLIPTSSHVPIPWVMGYDLRPLQAMREKEELLDEVARKDWILFFEHDAGLTAATVQKSDKGFSVKETLKF